MKMSGDRISVFCGCCKMLFLIIDAGRWRRYKGTIRKKQGQDKPLRFVLPLLFLEGTILQSKFFLCRHEGNLLENFFASPKRLNPASSSGRGSARLRARRLFPALLPPWRRKRRPLGAFQVCAPALGAPLFPERAALALRA